MHKLDYSNMLTYSHQVTQLKKWHLEKKKKCKQFQEVGDWNHMHIINMEN